LAVQDHRVLVVEKNGRVGGRLGVIEEEGFRIDIGPTIMLMIDVFRDLWRVAGRDFDAEVPCVKLDPNYRITWPDGSTLDTTSQMHQMCEQLEAMEAGSASRFLEFMSKAGRDYRLARAKFVERRFDRASTFFTPENIATLLSMKPFRSLYGELSRLFKDERLRQAFSYQTMYMGISPFDAPSIYGLLPYTEMGEGIWFPMGGYYTVAEAMQELAEDLGVTFLFNWPVSRILADGGVVRGVRGPGGEVVLARNVVANADLPYVAQDLLPGGMGPMPNRVDLGLMRATSSAYMMYLGVEGHYDHLLHHNIYFGNRFQETFEQIFTTYQLPDDPSIYIHAPTRTDPSLAPEGHDLIFVLVPVSHQHPNLTWGGAQEEAFRERVLTLLESRAGLEGIRDRIVFERTKNPDEWASEFNLYKGSTFGLSYNIEQVGWFRPGVKHPSLEGMYFAGSSTQPGTGVPLVVISGRLTSERMMADGR
ncbi:MAG: phytoene desaturase family protein, partial [Myxococcota bacterium]